MKLIRFERIGNKPIAEPNMFHFWESKATFNPTAILLNRQVHLIYRALSTDNVSVLGYAVSKDGINFERFDSPVYIPRFDFETKKSQTENSGCEDPRISLIGDRVMMFYTAYNGIDPPRIAMTSISVSDLVEQKWNWQEPVLISKPGYCDKDACVLPEKIGDNYIFFHREGEKGIVVETRNKIEFKKDEYLDGEVCFPAGFSDWESKKIGLGPAPVKTNKGWLLLYHGVSKDDIYRVGAMLLDSKNPMKIIGRTKEPLLEPEKDYEKCGVVNNVVFPCGMVVIGDDLVVYYGGGDRVIGAARINLSDLVNYLGDQEKPV